MQSVAPVATGLKFKVASIEIDPWLENLFYRENAMGFKELLNLFMKHDDGNGQGAEPKHRNQENPSEGTPTQVEPQENQGGGLNEVRTWP